VARPEPLKNRGAVHRQGRHGSIWNHRILDDPSLGVPGEHHKIPQDRRYCERSAIGHAPTVVRANNLRGAIGEFDLELQDGAWFSDGLARRGD